MRAGATLGQTLTGSTIGAAADGGLWSTSAWRGGEGVVPSRDPRATAHGRDGSARWDSGTEEGVEVREAANEERQAGHNVLLPLAVGAVFLVVLVLGALIG